MGTMVLARKTLSRWQVMSPHHHYFKVAEAVGMCLGIVEVTGGCSQVARKLFKPRWQRRLSEFVGGKEGSSRRGQYGQVEADCTLPSAESFA